MIPIIRLLQVLTMVVMFGVLPALGYNYVNRTAIMVINPALIDQNKVNSMLAWIADNSDYAVTNRKVDIRFANDAYLQKRWVNSGGERGIKIAGLTQMLANGHIIIYLQLNYNWNNQIDLTYLVHELVHFQQYVYGTDYSETCKDFSEFEAYTMALSWFREQGFDDETFVNDRLKHITDLDTCSN